MKHGIDPEKLKTVGVGEVNPRKTMKAQQHITL